jgi:hypothetical protein
VKPGTRMARVDELPETDIRQLVLTMPSKKFAQRGFLSYDRDASRLRFAPVLWPKLSLADRERLRGWADEAVARYFSRLGIPTD